MPERTCLVLSVGGAKGLAHLGAIEALREQDVRIDCIYGNSMGAVIGSLHATAPDQPMVERWQRLMGTYVTKSTREARRTGLFGALLGVGLVIVSGGTLGWETLLASAGGGAVLAKLTTDRFSNRRFIESMEELYGGAAIEALPIAFATSWQQRRSEGLELVIAREGGVAEAVGASANNPFIWKDTDVRNGRLDPGADRIAAVPVEDACATFGPARLIAVNVTGQPVFHSASMDCPLVEVRVPLGELKSSPEVLKGEGPVFEAVYRAGYESTMAMLRR